MVENQTSSDDLERSEVLVSGARFDEKYSIIELIGTGSFGRVYKARHEILNDYCALKVLKYELVLDEEKLARFKREAQIASKLRHPHLMQMRAFGVSPEGLPYLAMEYLEGASLADWIRQKGSLDLKTFRDIFMQLLDALAFAHENGVIHRDIKPANIVIIEGNNAKLIDLGLAKIYEGDMLVTETITKTGSIAGTPVYMSPEQCKGQALNPQSDIYSIAIVMYESLCGRPPFEAASDYLVMQKHLNEKPVFPASVLLPSGLKELILHCLVKDSSERPVSAREVAAALVAIEFSKLSTGNKSIAGIDLGPLDGAHSFLQRKVLIVVSSVLILTFTGGIIAAKVWYKPKKDEIARTDKPKPSLKRLDVVEDSDALLSRLESKRKDSHHSIDPHARTMEMREIALKAIKSAQRENNLNNRILATVMYAENARDDKIDARIQALRALEPILDKNNDVPIETKFRAYECLGTLLYENRSYEEAKQWFKKSAALESVTVDLQQRSLKAAASCCFQLQQDKELKSLASRVITMRKEIDNTCLEVECYLARRAAVTGDWDGANKAMKYIKSNMHRADAIALCADLLALANECESRGRSSESALAKKLYEQVNLQVNDYKQYRHYSDGLALRVSGQPRHAKTEDASPLLPAD